LIGAAPLRPSPPLRGGDPNRPTPWRRGRAVRGLPSGYGTGCQSRSGQLRAAGSLTVPSPDR
jgi:hypothetical protein